MDFQIKVQYLRSWYSWNNIGCVMNICPKRDRYTRKRTLAFTISFRVWFVTWAVWTKNTEIWSVIITTGSRMLLNYKIVAVISVDSIFSALNVMRFLSPGCAGEPPPFHTHSFMPSMIYIVRFWKFILLWGMQNSKLFYCLRTDLENYVITLLETH